MPSRKLRILIVAAEVAPFAKVGGLADVEGALPKALRAMGHDVRVAMPSYPMVENNPAYGVLNLIPGFDVPINPDWTETASILETRIDDVPVYMVRSDNFFRDATESRRVYSMEPEPYIFFNRAVAEMVPHLEPAWSPDVLHCNDWHTGLLPVYVSTTYGDSGAWAACSRVFTIHNLAYQGDFEHEILAKAGLPESLFTYDKLEFHGRMSFMKGGLVFSDIVNTVSRTYAEEIQTPEYGARLDGLLRYLAAQGRLTGIVNGIDAQVFDPATDPTLPARFSVDDPSGKTECKRSLQKECGLPGKATAPLIGIISRLADQKGFDLIAEAAERILGLSTQLVVLGSGEPRYEALFRDLEARYPKQVRAHIGFDADLAQRIYAGSDLFLMPSRFEPCGLGQLISLRYGTVPVVRATGGLADTIRDYKEPDRGNGFVFGEYSAEAMFDAVKRAEAVFKKKSAWTALVRRGMTSDYSWDRSAREYVEIYGRAVSASRPARAA